jgi:choline dehydrogenase-like flavoprotein
MVGPAVNHSSGHREVIVVGSGFGGAMVSWPLVTTGVDVLMFERGSAVKRGPHSWDAAETLMRTPVYTGGPSFTAHTDRGTAERHAYACVGGPSVYYGGVSLRFRERDFNPGPEVVADSRAEWPFDYETLSPYYDRAEEILGVAGRAGDDPTEPPRSTDYPFPPSPLSEVSRVIAQAARAKGLRPFRLPLAINFAEEHGRRACVECDTCDTFACALEAKNDVDVRVLRSLIGKGLELRSDTAVTELLVERGRVIGVATVEQSSGRKETLTADRVILAGGALGSARMLLASGLEGLNPAGDAIGRYLTRHCSGIAFGAYHWIARHEGRYHKQIGINDYYHGDPSGKGPSGPLGNLQQTQTPNLGTVMGEISPPLASLIAPLVRRVTGLLVIAEDRPVYGNRLTLSASETDSFGVPTLQVHHRYADRDLAARRFLAGRAKSIHRQAGALATYMHIIDTFSHALGTVRMGKDPTSSPLDATGRFRGVENLYVADGSTLPTAAGVNPSLTISANALRIGDAIVEDLNSGGRS